MPSTTSSCRCSSRLTEWAAAPLPMAATWSSARAAQIQTRTISSTLLHSRSTSTAPGNGRGTASPQAPRTGR
eukprot:3663221-Prymnesium_polylepis.1